MQFIDLQSQYRHLKKRIDKRIQLVLDHGRYIMGPEVYELEERLAGYVGVKHAITCANGTDALTLSLMALGIGRGDAVFCPTFTFFATAEAIASAGGMPVFVDSDKKTFNICPVDLEKRVNKVAADGKLTPKAIIAVDLFGLPANYPEIERIAQRHDLNLIEDAAQGFGGSIDGQRAGSFGDIATTSFFPAKPLGCYGDGGAVFTNDDAYAEMIRSLRIHGKGSDKYDNVRIGMNSRLDTIQAAILLEKLNEFPKEVILRNQIASFYSSILSHHFITPVIPENMLSSWAQFTLLSESRDMYIDRLKESGIPSVVYYAKCMHQQTAFDFVDDAEFAVAESLAASVFSLPMHPYINSGDLAQIVSSLLD